MIKKNATELNFLDAKGPMPAVEIDLETIPDGKFGYAEMVASALLPLAASSPDLKATVYVHVRPSVTFGGYGNSAFFGVAGSRLVLPALYDSFSDVGGLKVRLGDQIHQSQALREYHVEGGHLWTQEEAHVWFADFEEGGMGSDDENGDEDLIMCGGDEDLVVESGVTEAWPGDGGDEADSPVEMRVQLPARFRAARSDASVGSISRSIEAVYGLPEGAVVLRGPDKKVLRSDATIRTLRKRWE